MISLMETNITTTGGPTARIHIGLEDVGDLIADLEKGLEAMREYQRAHEGSADEAPVSSEMSGSVAAPATKV
jgi:hypothetical protein